MFLIIPFVLLAAWLWMKVFSFVTTLVSYSLYSAIFLGVVFFVLSYLLEEK